ncbi:uncharacterized protein LOC134276520 [Saccostrea cucullata]|uniref:uncharacterized protein LOC133179385 n=1 Tax=Saccostrea echinata TaxID=191078 RepID=UPI002A80991C|nr:uncharacterized protein LOC133179385 [Saccostrea echinata]
MSAMSEASLPVSWRTDSASQASGYSRYSRSGESSNTRKAMNVASAKHSGMRHPSWREPKPLKAASRPATAQDDVNGLPPRRKPILSRSNTTIESRRDREVQGIVNRLTAPTLAAKMKTIEFNKRTAYVDNNYYSWSNMAVYKDHQKMIYNDGGGVKRRPTISSRR